MFPNSVSTVRRIWSNWLAPEIISIKNNRLFRGEWGQLNSLRFAWQWRRNLVTIPNVFPFLKKKILALVLKSFIYFLYIIIFYWTVFIVYSCPKLAWVILSQFIIVCSQHKIKIKWINHYEKNDVGKILAVHFN